MQAIDFIKEDTTNCKPFTKGLTLFTFGCNFCCRSCNKDFYEKITNKDNVIGNAETILNENLDSTYDCVVFKGGEPLIWEDSLIEVLRTCRKKGLKIKIFSNGYKSTWVERINKEGLCDFWSISFKAVNSVQQECGVSAADYLINIGNSIFDILNKNIPLEIRTDYYWGNNDQRENIEEYVRSTFLRNHPEIVYTENFDTRLFQDEK